MPRGVAKTTPGRLNNREARALARQIQAEHPSYRASVFQIAQGLARVDVRRPDGALVIVRSAADLPRVKEDTTMTERVQGESC